MGLRSVSVDLLMGGLEVKSAVGDIVDEQMTVMMGADNFRRGTIALAEGVGARPPSGSYLSIFCVRRNRMVVVRLRVDILP